MPTLRRSPRVPLQDLLHQEHSVVGVVNPLIPLSVTTTPVVALTLAPIPSPSVSGTSDNLASPSSPLLVEPVNVSSVLVPCTSESVLVSQSYVGSSTVSGSSSTLCDDSTLVSSIAATSPMESDMSSLGSLVAPPYLSIGRTSYSVRTSTPSLPLRDSFTSSFSEVDSCPCYPLDDPRRHHLSFLIASNGGRQRFPDRSCHMFTDNNTYDQALQYIGPRSFTNDEFEEIWSREPLRLELSKDSFKEEVCFQGIVWNVKIPETQIRCVFQRGTVVVINGLDSSIVKYIATIRRHITESTSLVQLNVYSIHQDELRPDNKDWPALLVSVPNSLCDVPIPRPIAHGYREYITYPSTWNSFVEFIHSLACGLVTSGKQEVALISVSC